MHRVHQRGTRPRLSIMTLALALAPMAAGVEALELAMSISVEAPSAEPHQLTIDPQAEAVERALAEGDYAVLMSRAAADGITTVFLRPGGSIVLGGVALTGASQEAMGAAVAATQAAGEAGLGVVIGPIEFADPLDEASADAQALAPRALALQLERALSDEEAYRGLAVTLPRLPQLPLDPPAAQVEAAMEQWLTTSRAAVAQAADVLRPAGRRLYVCADSAALLALALEGRPEDVVPLTAVALSREPSIAYPLDLAMAGALGGGVILYSPAPTGRQLTRATAIATAHGAELISLGDVRWLQGEALKSEGLLRSARALQRFVGGVDLSATNRRIALLVDRRALAYELLSPALEGPGERSTALAGAMLLNAGGYPWRIALDAEGLSDEPAEVVVIPSGARLSDAALDGVEACVRAGGKVLCFSEFAAFAPAGGQKPAAQRIDADLLLPVERRRRTNMPVTTVRWIVDERSALHKAGDDVAVAPEQQAVYRAEVREGVTILAEYMDLRVPAAVAWDIGAGRLAWINALPSMLGDNLVADVLAYLAVRPMQSERGGDVRTPTYQAEREMNSRQRERVADYRSLVLNPETYPGPAFKTDGGVYDLYFEGGELLGFSLGYRREELPSGSLVDLADVDAGLHAYATALVAGARGPVWTDTSGFVEWPREGIVRAFVPEEDTFETWIYEPKGERLRSVGPGLYQVDPDVPHHALIDDGGALVLRAVQHSDDAVEFRVDSDATIGLRLQQDVLAAKAPSVWRVDTPAGPESVPEYDLWHVDHAGVLRLNAEGSASYEVTFEERPSERPIVELPLGSFTGARLGVVDGTQAIWLERYAYETIEVRFVHWDAAPEGATLLLHGVTGDFYGAIAANAANPGARLRIELNGAVIQAKDATTPSCAPDGDPSEWADMTIRIPKEAVRRGLNLLRITNEGPNWFAFDAAAINLGAQ